jgi:hypothetical protein
MILDDPSSGSVPAYVSSADLCHHLRITPRHLRAMVQRGECPAPACHLGRMPRWLLQDVAERFPAIREMMVAS